MNKVPSKAAWIPAGLLACACVATPVQSKVVITFTGTVTALTGFGATPPSGVAVGNTVSGTVTYLPAGAIGQDVGPGERGYIFPLQVEQLFTISIGTRTWRSTQLTIAVCDDVCDGDALNYAGSSQTAADFPGLLDSGIMSLTFSDAQEPYTFVNGTGLPDASGDVDFGLADARTGTISTSSGASLWVILFDVDSAALPVHNTTWGTVKALFGKP